MYVVPFVALLALQGRGYYLGPAYPMLLAGGSVVVEQWVAHRRKVLVKSVRAIVAVGLAIAWVVGVALSLPVAPVNSALWNLTSHVNDNFAAEIGWPEEVATIASIYGGLSNGEQRGILAGNYGEAGAIDLYGPAYGLPPAISGSDSYWLHGTPDPPPDELVVVGYREDELAGLFADCRAAGQVSNAYGVKNEETTVAPEIFVCRAPRQPWPALWPTMRRFQ